MPSSFALFLTIVFIAFLVRRESRLGANVTGALWIPVLWMLLICSRAFSQWLGLFGVHAGGVSLEEGSPVDAAVYFALIAAGFLILVQRRVRLTEIVRNNPLAAIFFIYCLVSILWSDFPFVALKRWIKFLGHPIMALVLLTEPEPEKAFVQFFKRCAYVLLPLSLVFIKYFPQWGRAFDFWDGSPTNVGVTTNKNELGFVCLIFGFFFVWHLLQVRQWERGRARRGELFLCGGFLLLICWLLRLAHSSTSLVALLVGIAVMLFLGLRFVDKRHLGFYIAAAIVLIVFAQVAFGIFQSVIAMAGRDPTFTGRTEIWKTLLGWNINPVAGTGFESFWLGERREKLAELYWWQPNEAHNGYLEIYLNLGLVGLMLMLALFFSVFRNGAKMLLENFDRARFQLGFLAAFVLYNWTEAAFKDLHPMCLVFFLALMKYPQPQPALAEESSEKISAEDDLIFESAPSWANFK
jgi:O-antigen ligase